MLMQWDFTPSFPVWSSKREAKPDVRLLPVLVCGATRPPEEELPDYIGNYRRSLQGTLTLQLSLASPTSGANRKSITRASR